MKITLAAGVALAALTMAASASADRNVVIVRQPGGELSLDANRDGWVTRAEAADAANAAFAQLDINDDGRLNGDDRPEIETLEFHLNDLDDDRTEIEIERALERAHRDVERAEREAERAEREVENAEREGRLVRRDVIIIRGDGEDHAGLPMPPAPPETPAPPLAPAFMMLAMHAEEADTNGDGALSQEEFRAQQLRLFDAGDANRDGRIRFEPMREPPSPPQPPAPPRHR